MLRTGKYFVRSPVGEVLSEKNMAIREKLEGILLATAGTTTNMSDIAGRMARPHP